MLLVFYHAAKRLGQRTVKVLTMDFKMYTETKKRKSQKERGERSEKHKDILVCFHHSIYRDGVERVAVMTRGW